MQDIELGPHDLMRLARIYKEKEIEAGLPRPSLIADIAEVLDRRRESEMVIGAIQAGRIEPIEMTLEQQVVQAHSIIAAQNDTIEAQGRDLRRWQAYNECMAGRLTKAHQRIDKLELAALPPLIGTIEARRNPYWPISVLAGLAIIAFAVMVGR